MVDLTCSFEILGFGFNFRIFMFFSLARTQHDMIVTSETLLRSLMVEMRCFCGVFVLSLARTQVDV